MSRKVPVQNLPHYGVKNGLKRRGHIIDYPDNAEPSRDCKSFSRAKRFMRTGKEARN